MDSQRKGKCAVIKTSTRQTYFLPVIGLVEPEDLKPGDLVVSIKMWVNKFQELTSSMFCPSLSQFQLQSSSVPVPNLSSAPNYIQVQKICPSSNICLNSKFYHQYHVLSKSLELFQHQALFKSQVLYQFQRSFTFPMTFSSPKNFPSFYQLCPCPSRNISIKGSISKLF